MSHLAVDSTYPTPTFPKMGARPAMAAVQSQRVSFFLCERENSGREERKSRTAERQRAGSVLLSSPTNLSLALLPSFLPHLVLTSLTAPLTKSSKQNSSSVWPKHRTIKWQYNTVSVTILSRLHDNNHFRGTHAHTFIYTLKTVSMGLSLLPLP